jgi:8-oxo-dGTP pyrophosphatase MutT (NUDIX family)
MAGDNTMIFQDIHCNEIAYDQVSAITWRVTVYVLAQRKGKILMTEPAFVQRWELPGGEVRPEETLLEGARREVWEETGYHLASLSRTPLHFEERYFYDSDNRYRHVMAVICAGHVDGEPDPAWSLRSDEIKRVAWIDPISLTATNTFSRQWPVLAQARRV